MREHPVRLHVKLDTQQPVGLGDFVGSFVVIGNRFERFVKDRHPDAEVDTVTYVREVRSGSIEADLSPIVLLVAAVDQMDRALIVEDVVKRWGTRIRALTSGDKRNQPDNKGDLEDLPARLPRYCVTRTRAIA